MRRAYDYEKDEQFLREVDELRVKDILVKITVLKWTDERPIKEIQGHVISGELSINKSSPVRRSGSLTIYVDETNDDILNIDNIISINKKVSIEIGIKNQTQSYLNHEYIWFKQGTFILTDLSITHDANGVQFSVNLADKMCLLDGSIGGVFTAATTLNKVDQYIASLGEYVEQDLMISDIILEAVHHLGGEELGNIIIADLDATVTTSMFFNQGIDNPNYIAEAAKLAKILDEKINSDAKVWENVADTSERKWAQLSNTEKLTHLLENHFKQENTYDYRQYDAYMISQELLQGYHYQQVVKWIKEDKLNNSSGNIITITSDEELVTRTDIEYTDEQFKALYKAGTNDNITDTTLTFTGVSYGKYYDAWKMLQLLNTTIKRLNPELQATLEKLYIYYDATNKDTNDNIQQVYQFALDKDDLGTHTIEVSSLEQLTQSNSYYVFNAQDSLGHRVEDFIYPGTLSANQGASITSILDNIVQKLGGNFEYFYDIDGRFHFQEIKNYVNTTYTSALLKTVERGYADDPAAQVKALAMALNRDLGKAVYKFDNSNLVISYNNQRQYSTVKNDFVVWGQKSTTQNDKRPIRYHLAIDTKPKAGDTHNVVVYYPYMRNLDGTLTFEDYPFAATPIFFDKYKISDEWYNGDSINTRQWVENGVTYSVDTLTKNQRIPCEMSYTLFQCVGDPLRDFISQTMEGTQEIYTVVADDLTELKNQINESPKNQLCRSKEPNISHPDAGMYYIHVDDKDKVNNPDVAIWIWDPQPPTDADGNFERPHWIVFNDAFEQDDALDAHKVEYRSIITEDWRNELYLEDVDNSHLQSVPSAYYAEMANEWGYIYNITEQNIDALGQIGYTAFETEDGDVKFREDATVGTSTEHIIDPPLLAIPAQVAASTSNTATYIGEKKNFIYSSVYKDKNDTDHYGKTVFLSENVYTTMNTCKRIQATLRKLIYETDITDVNIENKENSLYSQVEYFTPYEEVKGMVKAKVASGTSDTYTYKVEVTNVSRFLSKMQDSSYCTTIRNRVQKIIEVFEDGAEETWKKPFTGLRNGQLAQHMYYDAYMMLRKFYRAAKADVADGDEDIFNLLYDAIQIILHSNRMLYQYDVDKYSVFNTSVMRSNQAQERWNYFTKQCQRDLAVSEIIPTAFSTDKFYTYTPPKEQLLTPRMKKGFQDHPENYNYYLDFIDSSAKIGELSVDNIGRRTDAINNTSLNCMIDPDVPNIYLLEDPNTLNMELHEGESRQAVLAEINNKKKELELNNYPYAYISGDVLYSLTADHYQGLYEAARELLYTETSYNEKISISCMPIYHLDVNTRITVKDPKTGIYGDYLIDSINVPLDVSGTMNISCTKIIDRV